VGVATTVLSVEVREQPVAQLNWLEEREENLSQKEALAAIIHFPGSSYQER
jgi:hypothetical protein